MSNVYDAAVIAWANDRLSERGYNADAVELRFKGWDGCWSSWTQDYGVRAIIIRSDGSKVELDYVNDEVDTWGAVLSDLPAYVAAEEAMRRLHDHDTDDD